MLGVRNAEPHSATTFLCPAARLVQCTAHVFQHVSSEVLYFCLLYERGLVARPVGSIKPRSAARSPPDSDQEDTTVLGIVGNKRMVARGAHDEDRERSTAERSPDVKPTTNGRSSTGSGSIKEKPRCQCPYTPPPLSEPRDYSRLGQVNVVYGAVCQNEERKCGIAPFCSTASKPAKACYRTAAASWQRGQRSLWPCLFPLVQRNGRQQCSHDLGGVGTI